MASIFNAGNQRITFNYKEELLSVFFNKLNHNLHTVGIYEGGDVSIIDSLNVNVSPMVVVITDTTQDISIRGETTETALVGITPDKPYIVVSYTWRNTSANYMNIIAKAKVDITSDDLILGRGVYDNISLTAIDTSERTISDFSKAIKETNYFKVTPSEPYGDSLIVSSGEALFENQVVSFIGGLSPSFNLTLGQTRTDLLGVNVDTGLLEIQVGASGGGYPEPNSNFLPITYVNITPTDTVITGNMLEEYGRKYSAYNPEPVELGYYSLIWQNLNLTTAPIIKAGSQIEVNGILYKIFNDIDYGLIAVGDGTFTAGLKVINDSVSPVISVGATNYQADKRGHYIDNDTRGVLQFTKESSTYTRQTELDRNKTYFNTFSEFYYKGVEIRKFYMDELNELQCQNQWVDFNPGNYIGARSVVEVISTQNFYGTPDGASVVQTVFSNGEVDANGSPFGTFSFSPTGAFGPIRNAWFSNEANPVAFGVLGSCEVMKNTGPETVNVDFGTTAILAMKNNIACGSNKYSVPTTKTLDIKDSVWTSFTPSIPDTYNYVVAKNEGADLYSIIQSDAFNMIRVDLQTGAQTPVTTKPTAKIIGTIRKHVTSTIQDIWSFISADGKVWELSSDYLTFTENTDIVLPAFTSTKFYDATLFTASISGEPTYNDTVIVNLLAGQGGELLYSVDGKNWNIVSKLPAEDYIGAENHWETIRGHYTNIFVWTSSNIYKIPLATRINYTPNP